MIMDKSIILVCTVFLLGIRHGFDLDHIASIDAITRNINQQKNYRKWAGFLFSLGHGIIVTLINLIITFGFIAWKTPSWLDTLGNAISLFFLFSLSILTVYNLIKANQNEVTEFVGMKKYLYQHFINKVNHPLLVVSIGALFALSFDTFSQVSLFSLAALSSVGWILSFFLGVTFTLGMMLSDGLNGMVISYCIRQADSHSILISRLLGFSIAIFSLTIGILGLLQHV
jgi:high-affinity nickel-transport protein